jgi:hypothetical protein
MTHNRIGTLLFLTLTILSSIDTYAQTSEQNVNVKVVPSQTVEERVADSIKEQELKKAAEEKLAKEEALKLTSTNPKELLKVARIIFISSNTSFFEAIQLQNELRKQKEFQDWQLAIIDGWDKRKIADICIEVDRPLFTYTFTYKITDQRKDILLTTGKLTAFDGNAAAPLLAKRIIGDIKEAREELKATK